MEVDDLYALALEDFVRERDALAKRLRADGDRSGAADVKALTKPSRAAWAVNQLMRSQPKARRSLLEAGEAAERAGGQLGTEKAADELRLAASAGGRAVRDLLRSARGLTDAQGRSLGDQPLQAVESTLHAALVDPEAREAVAAARLSRDLVATGFPSMALSGSAPAKPRKPAPKKPSRAAIAKAGERVKKAQAELRRREREERAAQTAADRASAAAERARKALAEAQAKAEKLSSS